MTAPIPFSPDLRAAFEEYNKEQKVRLYKWACWFTAFGMPAGVSLDMNLYPAHVGHFLELRLLSSAMALILFSALYTSFGLRHYRFLTMGLPLIPQGFISSMIYLTEGSLSPYYAGLSLILLAFCLLLPWSFLETLFLSAATLSFYLAACLLHGGVEVKGIFFSNLYFLSMTALFATIGSYFTNRLRVREFATRFELDRNRKQLEDSNLKLRELDQAKTRFFANLSHELRTPLTLLISPLEALLAKGKALDPATRDTLSLMQANAMRLLKLINDLLDLVKLESGRMEARKEPLVLEPFLKGLAGSLQGLAQEKRVLVGSRITESLGTALLDKEKMEKVLLNLLFNALKFTPAGGKVELEARREGEELVLKVSDTGMGIDPKDLPFIFDRFWQADPSDQRKYQGTGIGLALVKELTEVQGGSVRVESKVGQGTTVTVRLPFEATFLAPSSGKREEVLASGSEQWLAGLYHRAELFTGIAPISAFLGTEGNPAGGKPKVLVADDEPDMLAFLRSELGKEFEVLEALDGDQAVQKAKHYLPEIVLLDMMMPGKDGITACREIKAHFPTRDIPVVLLTARADDATKMEALQAGASDFLAKPFSVTELHVRVANLAASHRSRTELVRQKKTLESALEQLKETETQLVQTEKMASLGRLSAGIIHEINNPLNYAVAALHQLKGKSGKLPPEERPKYEEFIADAQEGVERVSRIVSDLRSFTRPGSGLPGSVDLEEAVETSLRFLGAEFKDRVDLEVSGVKGRMIWADRNDLIHVLVNLFQNSLDAFGEKAFQEEKPRLHIKAQEEDGSVSLLVRDNGPGIAPEHLGKVFDPFFTTKEVGRGMGLGLSICYKLIQRQGGSISVKSEKGKYTEFILKVPGRKPSGKG